MARLVKADAELQAIDDILQSAPGVGPIVSATLIAELPELETIDRRAIAALAGLARAPRDSGKRSGPRAIEGGHPVVKTMLYLAGLHASRIGGHFRDFRDRLQRAGKTPKVTTARKLLVALNACSRPAQSMPLSRLPEYSCRQTRSDSGIMSSLSLGHGLSN
jgi:transposase